MWDTNKKIRFLDIIAICLTRKSHLIKETRIILLSLALNVYGKNIRLKNSIACSPKAYRTYAKESRTS